MSAAYFVEAGVIEGPDEGEYKKVHWTLETALADFMRLLPVSESATLRFSS
jgi:hypothetical protein